MTGNDDGENLREIIAGFGRFDIKTTWPGISIAAMNRVRPVAFAFEGALVVKNPGELLTAGAYRRDLLHRFEMLLSTLKANRWVLTEAPDFRMRSHLVDALWTLDGQVVQPELEDHIYADVDIAVRRCVARKGHIIDIPTEVGE